MSGEVVTQTCTKGNRYYQKKKALAFETLGGRCIKCGFSDIRALQPYCIYGDDARAKREGLIHVYLDVLKHADKYELLCANCKCIKRVENHEGKGGQRRLTPFESARLDKIKDYGKVLDEALIRNGNFPLECFQCHSKNTIKYSNLYTKNFPDYILEDYKCRDCGYEGYYKRKVNFINN